MVELKVIDLDIFFLSFDEPNADLNWSNLLDKAPWAKRVHGVKGFDAAHKECARQSTTDYFITIDADNIIKPEFTDHRFVAGDKSVTSWGSYNHINGLIYGNGGVKCWPKETALSMSTHEETNNKVVDFCWDIFYEQHDECFSTTFVNASPYQAFRAGFREGVKMSLNHGQKGTLDFMSNVLHSNLQRLQIWCSVGSDVENGLWAIYGARLGCYMLNLTDWDYGSINDYDWFKGFWSEQKLDIDTIIHLGTILERDLGLITTLYSAQDSKFFKSVYVNPIRNM